MKLTRRYHVVCVDVQRTFFHFIVHVIAVHVITRVCMLSLLTCKQLLNNCDRTTAIWTSFTMIVAGATGTGKTHFVLKLIDNMHTIIKPTPSHIGYYFMEDQPIFGDYPR